MTLELRSREQAQDIFNTRVSDIEQVLLNPEIGKIFSSLPKDPRICDLFTGTGAVIKAIYERLVEFGKPPNQIVGVDTFNPEDENLNASMISLYNQARYPLSQAETERNLISVSTEGLLIIEKKDVLDYLRELPTDPFPFDLVTGFSVPLNSKSDESKFEKMIRIIPKKCPSLFTFGATSEFYFDFLIQNLRREDSMQNVWKFYPKPHGVAPPDWDIWIMTNRNLRELQ